MSELDPNTRDQLVSGAKSAAGALPFVGSLVSEVLTNVIPDLRFERVVTFLKALDAEVQELDERLENFERNLHTENGIDIFEEGILQSSRAVRPERKERIARFVACTLSSEDLAYEESKKLLNLFRELTDPEILWLIYYSMDPVFGEGPHSKWVELHPEILKPISQEMGAPREQLERAAFQESYKATLVKLGLAEQKNRTIRLTALGRLLVRYIHNQDEQSA